MRRVLPRLSSLAIPCAWLAACAATPREVPWTTLFDGRTLGAWQPTAFGGEGEVRIERGSLVLDFGNPLTGVTWHGELPAGDYELEVEAARELGDDFFCGLTFPVGERHLTLVLGGWGGSLVGLSSLDGADASSNETTRRVAFERGRPYLVRLRVAGDRVAAWLDGEPLVDVSVAGRALSLRPEVELSRPLGIASYATRASVRSVRLRGLHTR